MATLSGVNYALISSEPTQKVPEGQLNGKPKVLYDEHTFVANVNAISDIIKFGPLLPKGARVIDVTVLSPTLGTTGIINVGWAASADAVEAADADGFIVTAQGDLSGQALLGKPTFASAGIGKKFEAAVQVQAVFTEATDAASAKTIKCWVTYVMD